MNTKARINVLHADTCLPCYWGGHHMAHLQVPVDGSTTFAQLREMLLVEVVQGAVAGNDHIAQLLSSDVVRPSEEHAADWVTREVYRAIKRDVRPAKKYRRLAFPDLERPVHSGSDYSVCAFFIIELEGEIPPAKHLRYRGCNITLNEPSHRLKYSAMTPAGSVSADTIEGIKAMIRRRTGGAA